MSQENKQTQYCGSAKQLGEDLLIELNINQLKDILANPSNEQFKSKFTSKDGKENQVIKLKAVKRKESQGFSTHFLCLNDYVKQDGAKKQEANDFPF